MGSALRCAGLAAGLALPLSGLACGTDLPPEDEGVPFVGDEEDVDAGFDDDEDEDEDEGDVALLPGPPIADLDFDTALQFIDPPVDLDGIGEAAEGEGEE